MRSILLSMALAACASTPPARPAAAPATAAPPAAAAAPSPTGPAPAVPAVAGPAAATGRHGMVVAAQALAARVGRGVLRAGGNAVDAAVATAFALAVTHPYAGNLGGGGFAIVRLASGETAALDFRETAPGAATRDMYLGPGGQVTGDTLLGHRAAGVPGSVAGLWALHKRYGSRPWAELLAPAIALARDGFVVDEQLNQQIARVADDLRRYKTSAALFLPGGAPPAPGSMWRDPDLAATLERIARRGPEDFYAGKTARLIVAEMRRGGGLITRKDLAGYHVEWRAPIEVPYRGYTIVSMPPSSSGGVTLGMTARILQGYDLRRVGWHSAAHIHFVVEAWRRSFAARNRLLGDPAFVRMPLATLLSPEHAAWLRGTIDPVRATPSESTPVLPDEKDTTHLGVVDAAGNAVALTTTINTGFGAKVVVRGAGFLLNDEMDDFAAKPGTPNTYGLVQGEANAIQPGKRMLSSMSPTIVLDKSGRVAMVLGAYGGARIITAVWQVLSNVVDFGMEIGPAVAAPRFHHQQLPDVIMVDDGAVDAATRHTLEARGYRFRPGGWYLGCAPSILRRDDTWTGVADPRCGGLALGVN